MFLKKWEGDFKKDLITQIQEDYKGSDDIDSHFEPPRFPSALWSAVQNNHADVFRLKVILKAQENLYLSIKVHLPAQRIMFYRQFYLKEGDFTKM